MNIPPGVLEATNGALWVALMFAALGAAWWLAGCVRHIGSFKQLYLEEKASIALLFAWGGLGARLVNVWWMQHLRNHGKDLPPWDGAPTTIHVAATLIAIMGVMCWLRCTLPEALGWVGWAILTGGAIAFGVLMAL